jgi:hypothetical protein
MTIHKRIRVTPLDREEIWRLHGTRQWSVGALAQQVRVSRIPIAIVLEGARRQSPTGIHPFVGNPLYGCGRYLSEKARMDSR